MATIESLSADVAYLRAAVDELLRRIGGVPPQVPSDADSLPDPVPGEGIASYTARCGQIVGGPKGEQAVRASGSMILYGQYIVEKHGGSWKKAVWEFINGQPGYVADPAWGTYRPGQ